MVVVTGLALLALPAALLHDKGRASQSTLEESSRNPARRLSVAKSGARGRNQRPEQAATKGLFSADGMQGSKTEKEKLLLTLLKNLEQVFLRLWDSSELNAMLKPSF